MKLKTIPALGATAAALGAGGAYALYRYIFYSPVGAQNDDHALVLPYRSEETRQHVRELIDKLNARPCERVHITSFDGLRLAGRYYHTRNGAPLAILCHGYRGTPSRDFCGGADICLTAGYNVLLIEQRAHCSSEGHAISFGVNERRDVSDWARWAVERFGPEVKILLVGISMGAATVLMASELDLPANVRGIIADCPYTSPKEIIKDVGRQQGFPAELMWPVAKLGARVFGGFTADAAGAITAVPHAKVPILLIHGEADDFVPCDMGRAIAAANPDKIEFHIFPSARHGVSYLVDTERYTKIVTEFCERVLKE